MAILGIILIVLMIGLTTGNEVQLFIDVPTYLALLGFTVGTLLISGTPIGTMLRATFSRSVPKSDLELAVRGWQRTRVSVISSGWMTTLIGLVIMLSRLDDYDAFAPGSAIAILAVFWALVFAYCVCRPLQYKLEDRIRGIE